MKKNLFALKTAAKSAVVILTALVIFTAPAVNIHTKKVSSSVPSSGFNTCHNTHNKAKKILRLATTLVYRYVTCDIYTVRTGIF